MLFISFFVEYALRVQEAVAVTTAIQEEILLEMGIGAPPIFHSIAFQFFFLV